MYGGANLFVLVRCRAWRKITFSAESEEIGSATHRKTELFEEVNKKTRGIRRKQIPVPITKKCMLSNVPLNDVDKRSKNLKHNLFPLEF